MNSVSILSSQALCRLANSRQGHFNINFKLRALFI